MYMYLYMYIEVQCSIDCKLTGLWRYASPFSSTKISLVPLRSGYTLEIATRNTCVTIKTQNNVTKSCVQTLFQYWRNQMHPCSGSLCVYKAGWCARQAMRIPCWWELTSLKQRCTGIAGLSGPTMTRFFNVRLYAYTCIHCMSGVQSYGGAPVSHMDGKNQVELWP